MARRFFWVLLCVLCRCASHGVYAHPSENITGVSEALSSVSVLLEDKRFDEARGLLENTESRLKNASGEMRMHPAFTDLQEQALLLNKQLEALEVQSKAGKRMALQASLMERGVGLMQQGETLLQQWNTRPAQAKDLVLLDGFIQEMADLEKQGRGLRSEQRYRDHAMKLSSAGHAFYKALQEQRWLMAVSDAVKGLWANTKTAKVEMESAADASREQAQSYETMMSLCAAIEKKIHEKKQEVVHTPSGMLFLGEGVAVSLVKFEQQVKELYQQASLSASSGDWKRRVGEMFAAWNKVYAVYVSHTKPSEALKAHRVWAQTVEGCFELLNQYAGEKSADFTHRWQTPWGEATLLDARAHCKRMPEILKEQAGMWEWKQELEVVQQAWKECAQSAEEAAAMPGVLAPYAMWQDTHHCAMQVKESIALLASASYSPWLHGRCSESSGPSCRWKEETLLEIKRMGDILDGALQRVRRAVFWAGCKGDECTVLRDEGLPLKVQTYPSARVFHYSNKKTGFDLEGHRQDFWRVWDQGALVLVKKLSKQYVPNMAQVSSENLHAYANTLALCGEHFSSVKQPGFDARKNYPGPWGLLGAGGYAHKCQQQYARVMKKQLFSQK
jgi:hypothetical protein